MLAAMKQLGKRILSRWLWQEGSHVNSGNFAFLAALFQNSSGNRAECTQQLPIQLMAMCHDVLMRGMTAFMVENKFALC